MPPAALESEPMFPPDSEALPRISALIEAKLTSGKLPHNSIPGVWGGPGNGESCERVRDDHRIVGIDHGRDRVGGRRRHSVPRAVFLPLGYAAKGAPREHAVSIFTACPPTSRQRVFARALTCQT